MKTSNCTVLIAEDDQNDQLLLKRAFKAIGANVILQLVNNGAEAKEYLNGEGRFADRKNYQFPSFIITDLKMPVADGFAILQFVCKHPMWRIIPTVVLSASHDLDDIKKAYMLGASSYHVKPGKSEDLRHQVRLLYEYWMSCELPAVDETGQQLPTCSEGKLGERFADSF